MTLNVPVCTICCRPEAVDDVISGPSVKTIGGNLVVNFEVASSNNFRDIPKNHFLTSAAAAADIGDSIKLNARSRFA